MESKKVGGGNCGCCIGLSIAIAIGALGVAVAILFGVLYHRYSIDGQIVVVRAKISELERQINQSQAAVVVLQGKLAAVEPALQVKVQNTATQLDQAIGEVRQTSTEQVQAVGAEFIQELTDIISAGDVASNTIIRYQESSASDLTSRISAILTEYNAQAADYVQGKVSILNGVIANMLTNDVQQLPINIGTQRTSYTRWGNSTCPDVTGTSLVYSGYAGGSVWFENGGGANILCMPMDPEYDNMHEPGVQDFTRIYGSEYESAFLGTANENVPCAVCSVSPRSETLMIPAKIDCPATWTREYYGYLMAENVGNRRTTYTCVDVGMESIPGSTGHMDGCDLWLVEPSCDSLPCPPYDPEKELACVVCSK